MEYTNGTKGTFTHPSLPKMGAMTGEVEHGSDGSLFLPDEKYRDRLYHLYDVEGEAGLYLEGGTFTPAE